MKCLLTAIGLILGLLQTSYGLILYNGDNSANQTAPDNSREDIFQSVARICNATGNGGYGSAICIQGKYLLTASHVSIGSHVTFDGEVLYERDTSFSPKRIADTDMKLFKLIEDPLLPEIELNTNQSADIGVSATLIGWGVGRDMNTNDSGTGSTNVWKWGTTSTFAKRWGLNNTQSQVRSINNKGTYKALITELNTTANEAGISIFDSGSGLFIKTDGTWKLAGLATLVVQANPNASTFREFQRDKNYFVRISEYATNILAAIPNKTTYAGWKVDHGLYGPDAENSADSDNDGITQLLEFAFGGDPNKFDAMTSPVFKLIKINNETYLEASIIRPKGLHGISYIPQTTEDSSTWPDDSIGIVNNNPQPIDNGDGTETLTYRRSQPVRNNNTAFIRIKVNELP